LGSSLFDEWRKKLADELDLRLYQSRMMTLPLLIALLAAASPPPGSILAAADAFDRAQLTKDRAAMERFLLDDLVFIDGSGKRLGKKAFIDGWTTGRQFRSDHAGRSHDNPARPRRRRGRGRGQPVRNLGWSPLLQPYPFRRHVR